MARREGSRRLIVNADDFGRSSSINEAVVRAHREGILTSASLMVNGAAFSQAVDLAKQNPGLGVGLHIALVGGSSTLPPSEIPGLVDEYSEFSDNPTLAGYRYFFDRKLHDPLYREIGAQFRKFSETGLSLDHVNGHLHFHLHPVVFSLLEQNAAAWGVRHLRLTRDRLSLDLRLSRGAWLYRLSHALIFGLLASRVSSHLERLGIHHTRAVFGLLRNDRVDADYVTRLLPRLPPGDSELYSHPSLDEFRHEFEALISPTVKKLIKDLGIETIRYQDL